MSLRLESRDTGHKIQGYTVEESRRCPTPRRYSIALGKA